MTGLSASNPRYRPERNQVWKFDNTLWRVDGITGAAVELSELLGVRSMTALTIWLQRSPEWELIYEHNPPESWKAPSGV